MVEVSEMVLKEGIVKLSTVFRAVFPNVTYRSSNAKRHLLRIPLVAIPIKKELYLMEKINEFNYMSLVSFLELNCQSKELGMCKNELKDVLSIMKGDKERECLRYVAYKCSGLSQTQMRKHFGLESMESRAATVESAIREAQEISNELDNIAEAQCQALKDCYGVTNVDEKEFDMSDTAESDCDDNSIDNNEELLSLDFEENLPVFAPNEDVLMKTLVECGYNWFEFVEDLERQDYSLEILADTLDRFFLDLPNKIQGDTLQLVVQSHRAFIAADRDTCMTINDRAARSINGEVVTESESELDEPLSASNEVKYLVIKKQSSVKRRTRRLKLRILAEKRLLSRKVNKRTIGIIKQFPNIGEVIEEYVMDHNVGADSWRRTGVLTFDGNTNLKNKVTYKGIQQHLKKTFSIDISYGTVVELCIPRNKRRRSAKRYRGFAKVTTRRARKGFNLRYNPDAHWSAAFYKGLNKVQYENGHNILNINRDDASGFRLDTLTTCKQYATPSIKGTHVLTTRTDYVNKTPSVLQTTSYNFSRTRTTSEVCAGVVKSAPIHQKNPAQHYSDLQMLENQPSMKAVFYNCENGHPKLIDCIRVDGACDEGPSHEVVQYFWTDWHFSRGKVVTLLTSRSSGSSYLNRVELQNGCLSLGHANTFIPSTLGGSCIDSETGNINEEKLKHNLTLAIDAYISRVDGCPCGETTIKLFRGSDSGSYQSLLPSLEIFLKGSKKSKNVLRSQQPQLYSRFEEIWAIRNRHIVHGLPPSYIFFLKCCFESNCPHPICRKGGSIRDYTWYPGGPPVSMIPLISKDPDRPWGSITCSDHKRFCTGHYKTIMVDVEDKEALKAVSMPPSMTLKQAFTTSLRGNVTKESVAEENLLSTEEVAIWLDHLNTVFCNRKRGAAKAAITRQKKKMKMSDQQLQNHEPQNSTQITMTKAEDSEVYHCASCLLTYSESTAPFWIACDNCNEWYCSFCEELHIEPTVDVYFCTKCQCMT